jgi:hypothetical protein
VKKIAVVILHGVGNQKEDYADRLVEKLKQRFSEHIKQYADDPASEIVVKPINWGVVFHDSEVELWKRLQEGGELNYLRLRRFIVEFFADAIAYQPTTTKHHNYDRVHKLVAEGMKELAQEAGNDAPLCLISHSLGSVIASNYFYDLQNKRSSIRSLVKENIGHTPLEQGDTLSLFYSAGSPLALWSLRYEQFGKAVQVPSPYLVNFYPNLQGEWLNFYDKDDCLAFPLKTLNEDYQKSVTEDIEMNAGGIFSSWNPLSHFGYMDDKNFIVPIVTGLVRTWLTINEYKEPNSQISND